MANSTLLQLVNRAQNEMSLSAPTTIIGNSTQEVVQLLALVNAVGYELQREHDWQQIDKEYRTTTVYYTYTGTTTSGSTSITSMSSTTGLTTNPTYFMVTGTGINQDTYVTAAGGGTVTISQAASASGTAVSLTFSQTLYPLPSDYDRQVDNTQWDKSRHWEMLGPETGQQWQWLKSGYISTGPRMRYRILGGFFQIWPPSGIADYIGWEYISKNWVLSASASVTPDKASFTVDTDTCIFPDTLMVLGLKSKYMQAKAWADAYGPLFESQKSIAIANDAGSAKLSMAPRMSEVLIGQMNIPDSGYGT